VRPWRVKARAGSRFARFSDCDFNQRLSVSDAVVKKHGIIVLLAAVSESY
jgi:hypothetical protein